MPAFKVIPLLVMSLLLGACGPNPESDLPPPRPFGQIAGKAVAGPIAGAQVVVYGLADGARLASGQTDLDGGFDIPIQAPNQPVLLELSGGQYREEANDEPVDLAEGQVLRAVGQYISGQRLDVMLTPMSHMASALAEYKIDHGMSPAQGISEAHDAVDGFFGLDVLTTRPADVTTPPDQPPSQPSSEEPSAEALYGLYLAGLSHWSQWYGRGDAKQWNSLTFAQIVYRDLVTDGLLDGLGENPDDSTPVPLGYNSLPLDADAYRLAFSLHMLAFGQRVDRDNPPLLDIAQTMTEQRALVPEESQTVALDGQGPVLNLWQIADDESLRELNEFANKPHSGSLILQIDVGGILGAKKLEVSIVGPDGQEIDRSPADKPLDPLHQNLVIVDTNDYKDGQYTFTIRAEDLLGTISSEQFQISFDNTAPTVTITSPIATNQASTTLSGHFDDNIAGVASITVDGQPATLFNDGTWQIEVALAPGPNSFPITVTDLVGNQSEDLVAEVYLDDRPPSIDSTGHHGQAHLSNGDGTATPMALQDSNGLLYFESDRLDLAGTLIERNALAAADIPYFGFVVSDTLADGVPTPAEELTVRMQYRHNDQVLGDWRPLTPVAGEYLVPLASETLVSDWHRTKPADQHVIVVEVSDPAGNRSTAQFDFYADIYVPALDIANDNGDPSNHIDELGQDLFTNTPFAQRASLNGQTFASTGYTFRNTTGKAFYLSLGDSASHTTGQVVEKLLREHRVHKKITTEWRIGLMTPTDNCPTFDPINGAWQYPTTVWNWNGSGWVEEKVPAPTYGAEESIQQDSLPLDPVPSAWIDTPDFDNELQLGSLNTPPSLLTYLYDYTLDWTTPLMTAASVSAWTYKPDVSKTDTQTCPNVRYFQQRETYAYESVAGYPKGVITTETIAGTPTFTTTGFTVTDLDTGAEIPATGGWYRIPAGHTVTIQKQVATPSLTLYDDDISDPSNADYTQPKRLDKSLSWHVDQGLDITLVHDAGEANIADMPSRGVHVGKGTTVYSLTRN